MYVFRSEGFAQCDEYSSREISRGPQYFLKSELIRQKGIVMQHSQNHPVVTTARRENHTVSTELKLP